MGGNIFKENCDVAGNNDNDYLMERRWKTSIWLALTIFSRIVMLMLTMTTMIWWRWQWLWLWRRNIFKDFDAGADDDNDCDWGGEPRSGWRWQSLHWKIRRQRESACPTLEEFLELWQGGDFFLGSFSAPPLISSNFDRMWSWYAKKGSSLQ